MTEAILQAIERSAWGVLARESVFLYPLANVLHVLAVMIFFAAVTAMDLRLMGFLRQVPVTSVMASMRPVAVLGFGVILITGATLFAAEATATGMNRAFRLKMVLILLGAINAAVNGIALRRWGEGSPAVRGTAGLSLLFWLAVASAGRLISYA